VNLGKEFAGKTLPRSPTISVAIPGFAWATLISGMTPDRQGNKYV